ncbi:hypothetical protein [Oceanisphaera avium]|nr:hypothetical protein [Oceanisphaera avium]
MKKDIKSPRAKKNAKSWLWFALLYIAGVVALTVIGALLKGLLLAL